MPSVAVGKFLWYSHVVTSGIVAGYRGSRATGHDRSCLDSQRNDLSSRAKYRYELLPTTNLVNMSSRKCGYG